MIDREPDVPEERRIRFRIGVNLGDVMVERNDIFGDGVNIAARLEGLAAAGSICVSRMVHDQIGDRLPYAFEDMGEQNVKNIARPVRVYSWRHEGTAGRRIAGASPLRQVRRPSPRLSIVVLPFTNLGYDPRTAVFRGRDYRGSLDRFIADLANMFVISRNTAFTYRNKSIDTRQIGRELGVRYVLEGSVQAVGLPAPRQCPSDRCCDRRASLDGAVRPRHGRSVRPAKRDHELSCQRAGRRADRCRSGPAG